MKFFQEMRQVGFPGFGLEFEIPGVAFEIGGFPVMMYGLLICIGFVLSYAYAMRVCEKRYGVDSDRLTDCTIAGVIGGIIGARLFYVIFQWDNYKNDLSQIFKITDGGLAIYGGIIFAIAFGTVVCVLRKGKFLPSLDMVLTGFFIGQGIGRWGNFFNLEAYGSTTSLPWRMSIPGVGEVHPCFLYEFIWCMVGFLIAHIYSKHRRFDGEMSLFYMFWYGSGRFWIEGLRQDSLYIPNTQLRVSQVISAVMVVGALITWIVIRLKIKRENDPEYLKLYVNTEECRAELRRSHANDSEKKKAKLRARGILTDPPEGAEEDTADEGKAETEKEEDIFEEYQSVEDILNDTDSDSSESE